jgi:Spirocyclase AveC-like
VSTVIPDVSQPAVGKRRAVAGTVSKFWDTPVAWWAAGGAAFLALEAYVFIAWIASSDFKRIYPGVTPLPSWMKVALVSCCVSTAGLALWLLWRFVIKPWRREGHLTATGAFGLATCLMFWQDPCQNMIMPWFSYNHWLPNMGSWINQVPFMNEPHGTALADPIYASMPGFVLLYFGGMLVTRYVLERARRRNPDIGTPKLLVLSIGVATVVMGCLELAWMHTGFYIYPRTIHAWTLFSGNYYQIPFYEFLIDGVTVAAMGWIMFFRNDRGETVVERGMTQLGFSQKRRALLQFLAFTCMINIIFGAYDLAVQPFVLNAGSVPKAITERSYFMGGYCGQGTNMACWNTANPIPTADSGAVNPNGVLVQGKYPIAKTPPFSTKAK